VQCWAITPSSTPFITRSIKKLVYFEVTYLNDDGGRPAHDPAIFLKIILLRFFRGIVFSREFRGRERCDKPNHYPGLLSL